MVDVGRDLGWSAGPTPLLHCLPRTGCLEPCPDRFWTSSDEDSATFLGNLCQLSSFGIIWEFSRQLKWKLHQDIEEEKKELLHGQFKSEHILLPTFYALRGYFLKDQTAGLCKCLRMRDNRGFCICSSPLCASAHDSFQERIFSADIRKKIHNEYSKILKQFVEKGCGIFTVEGIWNSNGQSPDWPHLNWSCFEQPV